MRQLSAGLLVYRLKDGDPEVFIVHNGGPYWAKKEDGVWSLPKGEIDEGEEPLQTAKREFEEETGFSPPAGPYTELGETDYPRGHKVVLAWAAEGNFDAAELKSNTFEMEWPPRSGKRQEFPEIDRGGWFGLQEAARKLFPPNVVFLERLANHLHVPFGAEEAPEPPAQSSLF
jgi:predicted NUDIX family NTP pyrophosphohydrolase